VFDNEVVARGRRPNGARNPPGLVIDGRLLHQLRVRPPSSPDRPSATQRIRASFASGQFMTSGDGAGGHWLGKNHGWGRWSRPLRRASPWPRRHGRRRSGCSRWHSWLATSLRCPSPCTSFRTDRGYAAPVAADDDRLDGRHAASRAALLRSRGGVARPARWVTAGVFAVQAVSLAQLPFVAVLPTLVPFVMMLGAANGMSTLARVSAIAEIFGSRQLWRDQRGGRARG
jgi:hypothetical protein